MCSKQNRRLKFKCFNMITGIDESNTLTKHMSSNIYVSLMVETVIQIKFGIMINLGVSASNIIPRILLHVNLKMADI